MDLVSEEQRQRALEVMQEWLDAPKNPDGMTWPERALECDKQRGEVIRDILKPLLDDYLAGRVPLTDFKSAIDSQNKQRGHWGFKGIKGQMFFNVMANVADDMGELDEELKAALTEPRSEDMARSRIKTFTSYVKRLGDQHVEAGGSKRGRPKPSSVLFFLSYFWQIDAPHVWPVYYTNSVNAMTDLNLWQPSDDLAENYIRFKQINEQLSRLFEGRSGRSFGLYGVEHVFTFRIEGTHGAGGPTGKPGSPKEPKLGETGGDLIKRLPDSYVPPIVSILPRMARHEPELIEAAKASGTSLERAFEKYINAAFTILGYDTTLLGHGQGRVPDGRAIDVDNSYAILWDAKIRKDGYSMGTDDRTIREYITTQSRGFKKKRSLLNLYYFIVSSSFQDDYDDTIKGLKMETDINEVCLVEADALVAMVDAKLREPQQLSLGPDGLQRLYSMSGVLTSDDVRDTLA